MKQRECLEDRLSRWVVHARPEPPPHYTSAASRALVPTTASLGPCNAPVATLLVCTPRHGLSSVLPPFCVTWVPYPKLARSSWTGLFCCLASHGTPPGRYYPSQLPGLGLSFAAPFLAVRGVGRLGLTGVLYWLARLNDMARILWLRTKGTVCCTLAQTQQFPSPPRAWSSLWFRPLV